MRREHVLSVWSIWALRASFTDTNLYQADLRCKSSACKCRGGGRRGGRQSVTPAYIFFGHGGCWKTNSGYIYIIVMPRVYVKCPHGKRKCRCVECDGVGICPHKKRRSICVDCDGSSMCEHKIQRQICHECHGVSLCEHKIERRRCPTCDPHGYTANRLRSVLRMALGRGGEVKDRPTLDYYGVKTFQELKDALQLKIDHHNRLSPSNQLNFDNCAIDHIRPIAEFKRCDVAADWKLLHHITNLQPLIPSVNQSKNGKWNRECEDYWRANIISNPDYHEIFNPFQFY